MKRKDAIFMKVGSEEDGLDIIELDKGYEALGSRNALYPTKLTWKEELGIKETKKEQRLKDERLYLASRFIYEIVLDHYLIKKETPSFNLFSPFEENVDLLESTATEKQAKERCLELLLKEVEP